MSTEQITDLKDFQHTTFERLPAKIADIAIWLVTVSGLCKVTLEMVIGDVLMLLNQKLIRFQGKACIELQERVV
ncbi:hypothetical protein Q5762_38275, partial [Streptomyces sp. P9(2023)]|uniref:hypothetical protein n=1 Tax=Streptomyces sp. P9(2023) TaxID=3064394 RepID=UPI0028F42A64